MPKSTHVGHGCLTVKITLEVEVEDFEIAQQSNETIPQAYERSKNEIVEQLGNKATWDVTNLGIDTWVTDVAEVEITAESQNTGICMTCAGSGWVWVQTDRDDAKETCSKCDGTGTEQPKVRKSWAEGAAIVETTPF